LAPLDPGTYIDGASPVTAFFRLALPMSVPAIASLVIFQLVAAAGFIAMALPLAVFLALQRYFVRGIAAGSVKG
jgi:alpha-glucoside transport system permease protein